ncbi:MAG TPA: iron transporter [Nitrososphaera sp.]|nr:iron transporter [Nitrososphaera sp.]
MSKTCLKCGKVFDDAVDDPAAEKYPACPACWKEWTSYGVMVMNELRLDMSLPEHRKALRKYERAFFGLEKGIGEIEKKPDNPEGQQQQQHHH